MLKSVHVTGGLIGLLFLALAGPALSEDEFSAAEAAAHASAGTAEGRAFGELLAQTFGREHGSTIQRCAKETKRPELTAFDLLLRVDGTGLVDKALVKPTTNLARCVQGQMVGWKVAVPPQSGLWVNVAVNLQRK